MVHPFERPLGPVSSSHALARRTSSGVLGFLGGGIVRLFRGAHRGLDPHHCAVPGLLAAQRGDQLPPTGRLHVFLGGTAERERERESERGREGEREGGREREGGERGASGMRSEVG